jgi:hypothetical protein
MARPRPGGANEARINFIVMIEASALSAWESFYVIVGSSAAALTGLQFVVIALIAESEARRSMNEVAAFGTPTVVHFGAVLLISAILSAPWPQLANAATAVGLSGGWGVIYLLIVTRRARRTTVYKPVLEDWIWHVALPLAAYVTLLGGAVALPRYVLWSLFAIAASSVLLLFIGIHNAWDTVTYLAIGMAQPAANATASTTTDERAAEESVQVRAPAPEAPAEGRPSVAP